MPRRGLAGEDSTAATARSALVIRPMVEEEAEATSEMILRTLRETNVKDYSPEEIDIIAAEFTPERVAARRRERRVYVALEGERIVGTASLGPERINSVFVVPDRQGAGVGAALIAAVEELARSQGRAFVTLRSSLTAVGFYRRLGYVQASDSPTTDKVRYGRDAQNSLKARAV